MFRRSSRRAPAPRMLFSRDLNYLRDMVLLWPLIIFLIFAVGCAFSRPDRPLAYRFATVVGVAILLARERLLLFIVALMWIAGQSWITMGFHPSWAVFAAGAVSAAVAALLVRLCWGKAKLSYQVPDEPQLVDLLVGLGSFCLTLLIVYRISPYN
jgi:hypothetical protein